MSDEVVNEDEEEKDKKETSEEPFVLYVGCLLLLVIGIILPLIIALWRWALS